MTAVKKTKVRLTAKEWKFVEDRFAELVSAMKDTDKLIDVAKIVADALYTDYSRQVNHERFLQNYQLRMKKKHKKSGTSIVADPNDIKYTLLVYGVSGGYKPSFHCNREQLQRKIQDETNANGGVIPKFKIMAPITFKIDITEVHDAGV